MGSPHPRDLGLAGARALVQRAVDKAEQLGLRGAVAVVGASGTLLTASRMDAGGPGGMARAQSKAWISATQQIPSSEHLHRMTMIAPPVAAGFAQASPEALFPGAGGMPVSAGGVAGAGGVVVAGIAASGATVSPFFPDGVDPRVVSADGRPANPEDLLIAYALGVPYAGQHGDDQKRWEQRFGDLAVDPADSLGMAPAPPASRQAQLDWARALCDAAMAAATRRGVRVAVAVVDQGGDPVQQDLMDGAPAGGVAIAQAVAGAAALFDCFSGDLGARFGQPDGVLGAGGARGAAGARHIRRAAGPRWRAGGGRVRRRRRRSRRLRGHRPDRAGRHVTVTAEPVPGTPAVRVAVIGCGAIGSLYAAHLARVPGVEVWAVDPWAEHVDAIGSRGLRVTGLADFTAEVRASTDGRDLPACDFGLVATKALHTRAAVEGTRTALADAAVVSLQNGLGNEEVIAELVPRVIRGSIVTAGAIVAPGVVRYDAPGDSWFGPFEPRPAPMGEIGRLAGLLCAGGLRTHALADARGPQWTKVIFNSATSPLAALTGLPMGPLCTDRALRTQVDALATEALAVCERAGIMLVRPPSEAVDEAIAEAYDHKPSMLQDVLARRPTEIDVLNGGIAAEGRRAGVPTPRHDCMIALVKGLERSWSR